MNLDEADLTDTVSRGRISRILVVGSSGSGKSTLCGDLSAILDIPFFETDGIFWTKNWEPIPASEITNWLKDVVDRPAWLLDGNFENDRNLAWAAADLVIWLDLPTTLTALRVAKRNLGWWFLRTSVWGGRRMTLGKALSGVRHAIRTSRSKRRSYPGYLAALDRVDVIVLRSALDVRTWLATFALLALTV